MATREEIQTTIDEIDAKLSAGVESVANADTSVRFNMGELRRRRAELAAQLAKLDGTAPRIRQIRTYSGKGL